MWEGGCRSECDQIMLMPMQRRPSDTTKNSDATLNLVKPLVDDNVR